MRLLSRDEMHRLRPAETHAFPGPVPTQIVSSEEYFPLPQGGPQREVEARLRALGDELGRRYRYDRRAELGGSRRLAELKAQYERSGIGRSNRRYGYVVIG